MSERGYSRARAAQFQLRFSDDLHQRLKAEAARNERPLNAEIIFRLERSLEAPLGLAPELARVIDQYVDAEVRRRLQDIAAKIGGGA